MPPNEVYKGGPPKKTELSSGWQAPCNIGFHYITWVLDEYSGNPSVSVYQLALLWEAAFVFSELFLKNLSTRLPISWWVIYKHTCPHHCAQGSEVFDWKMAWTPCPTLPIHPISPWVTFVCFPGWKKILKGKHFADVEEVKQKMAEALKGIKIDNFKNYFGQ